MLKQLYLVLFYGNLLGSRRACALPGSAYPRSGAARLPFPGDRMSAKLNAVIPNGLRRLALASYGKPGGKRKCRWPERFIWRFPP
ncbi:MAG: hypothetical protein WBC90_11000 [Albidovulum sp.]